MQFINPTWGPCQPRAPCPDGGWTRLHVVQPIYLAVQQLASGNAGSHRHQGGITSSRQHHHAGTASWHQHQGGQ